MSVFKMKSLVLASLLIASCAAPALAYEPGDLCADPAQEAAATNTLQAIQAKLQAERPDLVATISSSGVETCNPTSVLVASADPGQMIPHIQFRNVCGAVFTFVNQAQMHEVAKWIESNSVDSLKACVSINQVQHHGVASSGN